MKARKIGFTMLYWFWTFAPLFQVKLFYLLLCHSVATKVSFFLHGWLLIGTEGPPLSALPCCRLLRDCIYKGRAEENVSCFLLFLSLSLQRRKLLDHTGKVELYHGTTMTLRWCSPVASRILEGTKSYICEAIVAVVDHLGNVSSKLEQSLLANTAVVQTERRIDCLKQVSLFPPKKTNKTTPTGYIVALCSSLKGASWSIYSMMAPVGANRG